jgi:hypothetical protein
VRVTNPKSALFLFRFPILQYSRLCTDPAHFASDDGTLRCDKCAVPMIHTIPFKASTVRAPFSYFSRKRAMRPVGR